MRFRLITLFTWTTAIAVVLFLIVRVIAPIIETEHRVSHGAAVTRAMLFVVPVFIVGFYWMRMRVITPRDRRLFRYTLLGAAIGACAAATFGLGQYFLSWRADFPREELGAAVGILLGIVPGAIVGMYAGRIADAYARKRLVVTDRRVPPG